MAANGKVVIDGLENPQLVSLAEVQKFNPDPVLLDMADDSVESEPLAMLWVNAKLDLERAADREHLFSDEADSTL